MLKVNQIDFDEKSDDYNPDGELSLNAKLISEMKQQRQKMKLISSIDRDTIVRCEYEDEENLYENYYGKIAGRSKCWQFKDEKDENDQEEEKDKNYLYYKSNKTFTKLGKIECPMLIPFQRDNGVTAKAPDIIFN